MKERFVGLMEIYICHNEVLNMLNKFIDIKQCR